MDLEVLHQDAALVAVNKPVGLASIPERDLEAPSAQRLIEARLGVRVWVVHRLDKEVSGALVFALSPEAHRALSMAFERRLVDKSYLALVHGHIAVDQGVIEAPIHQFGSGRMGVDMRGKASTTRFEVLERSAPDVAPACSRVLARPVTGRRHQLRVHLYHLGHPIVGDTRYGDPLLQVGFARLYLHALRVVLPRPPGSSGAEPLTIEAPPDPGFTTIPPARRQAPTDR